MRFFYVKTHYFISLRMFLAVNNLVNKAGKQMALERKPVLTALN